MVFWYLLLVIVPVVGIWYLVRDHKRKAAEREAASAERLRAMLVTTKEEVSAPAAARSPEPSVVPAAARPAEPPAPAPSVPQPPPYSARERILSPAHTLVYFLLRTGLPEYVVFAHVLLDAVLEAGAGTSTYARNEQMRRLVSHTLDFVVTDKSMRPVAVVELVAAGESQDQGPAARQAWLVSAGLRYIALEPRALPRKEALRALVLGEPAAEQTVAMSDGQGNRA